jgi:UDP-N-acetylglucosamine--N-acetylmuramyl-(pentapeptide) pyrophosphoryl-undecaprenol N-acetylglucosamine transferase
MMADRTIGRQTLGIGDDQLVIMGFGGSIGAQRINEAMIELCVHYHNSSKVHILHITGRDKYESVLAELASRGIVLSEAGNITIKPYLYNIQDAYGASDLIVSRAGGISLSELTAIGKPAIIVPYPHATNQHQDHNGRFLAHEGAAVLIADQELSGERLIYHVDALMNDPTALKQMADNSRRIGRPQAAEEIADFARELIRKRQSSHHGRSGLSNAGRD